MSSLLLPLSFTSTSLSLSLPPWPLQFLDFKCQCPPDRKGPTCAELSPPGTPSDVCQDVMCGEGEACVVTGTGKDDFKCEPCTG